MPSLSEKMNHHQVAWRQRNVSSKEMGTWRKKPYPWILPRNLWEEGLWPGIRTHSNNALTAYLKQARVQKHSGVHNLKSSWMLGDVRVYVSGGKGVLPVVMKQPRPGAPRCRSEPRRSRTYHKHLRS